MQIAVPKVTLREFPNKTPPRPEALGNHSLEWSWNKEERGKENRKQQCDKTKARGFAIVLITVSGRKRHQAASVVDNSIVHPLG